MPCLAWRRLRGTVRSRRPTSRSPKSSTQTGIDLQRLGISNIQCTRHANAEEAEKEEFSAKFKQAKVIIRTSHWILAGVNKKPKKFKTVWHGFRGILKLSGRVNQASLKLSAGFSNTVC